VIFEKISFHENYEWNYYFGRYTMMLNNITPELEAKISPNDSRKRTDMRALENQDIPTAAAEKDRIEEIQEKNAKWRKENPGNDF